MYCWKDRGTGGEGEVEEAWSAAFIIANCIVGRIEVQAVGAEVEAEKKEVERSMYTRLTSFTSVQIRQGKTFVGCH